MSFSCLQTGLTHSILARSIVDRTAAEDHIMTKKPQRGFLPQEYAHRLERAQTLMAEKSIDALLLTTEPEVRYFTGYLTRFWESPTRPWFLLVPASGEPIAIIPQIGEALMASTWINDIRTWVAPDLNDDGETLLADTIRENIGDGRIAIPGGHETHLRMPLWGYERLKRAIAPATFCEDHGIMRQLRLVKSGAEIEKISYACSIANAAFSQMHTIATEGMSMARLFARFQMSLLENGADFVPYVAGGKGVLGYGDVISPPGEDTLQKGDVFMLDTGATWDGYFCDFDRNFALGQVALIAADAHKKLVEATQAGFEAAKPGIQACDLFTAMDKVLTGGSSPNQNGRLGHGLGMQLTEWPSLIPMDETPIVQGMVLTLEPSVETVDGLMLVHEENIVITQNGAEYLSAPYPEDMQVIKTER